ncbi:hypothetical protein RchiOBHm_Chr3g0450991 [Rosa chinensis]|uniref:Uncharacterized protein n=1 Tax=Rosa chinensis TaxID=74649 RepID=A0A2P6R5X8_ROSCH|nr:hypothetical protein RchiOBHm_Chr3g0450991 [Rosa chinensis]
MRSRRREEEDPLLETDRSTKRSRALRFWCSANTEKEERRKKRRRERGRDRPEAFA